MNNADSAYKSSVFGGSVFLPIGKKNGKRDKRNPLEAEINDIQVDYLYGGGYYEIQNVRQEPMPVEDEEAEEEQYGEEKEEQFEPPEYWDVQMLVESVENAEELKSLKVLNESLVMPQTIVETKKMKTKNVKMPVTDSAPKKKTISQNTVPMDEMLSAMTGYGRIIKYQVFHEEEGIDAQNCELLYIVEGKFKNGQMDGYCRLIDCMEGEVHVGYFKDDMPQGKYQRFSLDGDVQE